MATSYPYYMSSSGQGLKDGSSLANAAQYSQAPLQTAITDLVANAIIYLVDDGTDTFTLTGTLALPNIVLTSATRAKIIAVDSAGDEQDDTRIFLDGDSAAQYIFSMNGHQYIEFRNLKLANSTSDLIHELSASYFNVFYNCEFGGSGRYHFEQIRNSSCVHCKFSNSTNTSINNGLNSLVKNSVVLNSGNRGLSVVTWVIDTIVHNSSSYAILNSEIIAGCVIDDAPSGTETTGNDSYILNTRFTNISGTAVYIASKNTLIDNVSYYNNGTDRTGSAAVDPIVLRELSLTSTGYNDEGADDFTLAVDGDGVGVSVPIGLVDETTNVAYLTSGITPEYSTGGGRRSRIRFHGV